MRTTRLTGYAALIILVLAGLTLGTSAGAARAAATTGSGISSSVGSGAGSGSGAGNGPASGSDESTGAAISAVQDAAAVRYASDVRTASVVQNPSAMRPGTLAKVTYGAGLQQWVHLTRPSTLGRRPTVLFVHGGGWVAGGVGMWQSEAAYWASRGWVTLNVSYRLGSSSTGTYLNGQDMLDDVSSALNLARSLPYVDRSRILVVGDSAGGHLASYLAARHYGKVAGMILWSPVAAPSVAEQTATAWDGAADCPQVCVQQRSLAARATLMFGWSATRSSPLAYLAHYGAVPTWVAGSADEWVPFDVNGGALCAASAAECAKHVVPGTLHATKLRDANPALVISARHWAAKTVGIHTF